MGARALQAAPSTHRQFNPPIEPAAFFGLIVSRLIVFREPLEYDPVPIDIVGSQQIAFNAQHTGVSTATCCIHHHPRCRRILQQPERRPGSLQDSPPAHPVRHDIRTQNGTVIIEQNVVDKNAHRLGHGFQLGVGGDSNNEQCTAISTAN